MGIREYKPTTPGRRQGSVQDFVEITDRKKKPEKSLLEPKPKKGGSPSAHQALTLKRKRDDWVRGAYKPGTLEHRARVGLASS